MTEKLTGIVLDITRHSDRMSIVTLFTRSRGRVAFLSPVGSGKSGKLRQARLQPMSILEAEVNYRQTVELQRLGAFSLREVWCDLYFDPVKRVITLFLAEFLNRLLRATMPDENMWDYISNSLCLLDRMHSGTADFHVAFLSSLLSFAGIQPDGAAYKPGYFFDMRAGAFVAVKPPHNDFLGGDEARFAALLSRITYSNVRILRLNGNLRREIIEKLLRYYSIHFPGTANLRSLDVIHDIFA